MPTKLPPRRVRLSDETSDFSPLLGLAAALLALLVVLAEAQAMSPPGEKVHLRRRRARLPCRSNRGRRERPFRVSLLNASRGRQAHLASARLSLSVAWSSAARQQILESVGQCALGISRKAEMLQRQAPKA